LVAARGSFDLGDADHENEKLDSDDDLAAGDGGNSDDF